MPQIKTKIIMIILLCFAKNMVSAQTVKDIDGNVYNTVIIGTQTWMIENLKTTKYRNGDPIGTSSPSSLNLTNLLAPSFQWSYENKENNTDIYGRLYTWYAVTDSRGVCPIGWHVSTDAEWSTMIRFLGGEVAAYNKLKESGNTHWIKYDNGTNELGFKALPGGLRNGNGTFVDMGNRANWWSTTELGQYDAWYYMMSYDLNEVFRHVTLKRNGLSVRCVKN